MTLSRRAAAVLALAVTACLPAGAAQQPVVGAAAVEDVGGAQAPEDVVAVPSGHGIGELVAGERQPAGAGPIARRWNLTNIPTLYLIDHLGVIRHKWIGAPDPEQLDAAIEHCLRAAEQH